MAFDLDNEELKATRKDKGLDDGLYEDKMSEEDFKILEDFKNNKMQRDKLERDNRCGGWKIGHIYKQLELNVAIEHILSEREQDKKRIKELEAENMQKDLEKIGIKEDTEVNMKEIIEKFYTANEKCIPKQKVKDKIEKLRNDIKLGNCRYPYVEEHKIDILQELLGGDEKK